MAWIDELPAGRTGAELRERERLIVEAVAEGRARWDWYGVEVVKNGRRFKFFTMADALKIDAVRVNVSATGAQQIADLLIGILPTPRLVDHVWRAAMQLPPSPQRISASTKAMIAHSQRVDKLERDRVGLFADVGKAWVLTAKITTTVAANYGWHVPKNQMRAGKWRGIRVFPDSLGGEYGIQIPAGTRHDRWHQDYSQLCKLIFYAAELDGRAIDIRELLEAGSDLVSHEGPLPVRQPGVKALGPVRRPARPPPSRKTPVRPSRPKPPIARPQRPARRRLPTAAALGPLAAIGLGVLGLGVVAARR